MKALEELKAKAVAQAQAEKVSYEQLVEDRKLSSKRPPNVKGLLSGEQEIGFERKY